VAELAKEIEQGFAGEIITLITVLQGAATFARDLTHYLRPEPLQDSICVTSYGAETKSNRQPRLSQDLARPISGKNVLIVEDILDSGFTLNFLTELLHTRNPKSLRVVTLLDKPSRRVAPLTADYVGFVVEDLFVVGYGLDFNQQYRELPDICVLSQPILSF
jgi:hypoxanthine phosphoribosyltransferase